MISVDSRQQRPVTLYKKTAASLTNARTSPKRNASPDDSTLCPKTDAALTTIKKLFGYIPNSSNIYLPLRNLFITNTDQIFGELPAQNHSIRTLMATLHFISGVIVRIQACFTPVESICEMVSKRVLKNACVGRFA
ncbi:hypothetical protein Tcan_15274 [Toxocara canis]|uniref:Uncharacterized protein n=1 Tax=Toxocara canis TaxID=6265 RepID=A0A0B2VG80_TOXCA|nr:hypothetical protein Tcan_15274 [Toxocara canis]